MLVETQLVRGDKSSGGSLRPSILRWVGSAFLYVHGLLETRRRNFKTAVTNVKIGLLFLSPFPQKLMKSFNFFCKSQTISLANVIKYQILKI